MTLQAVLTALLLPPLLLVLLGMAGAGLASRGVRGGLALALVAGFGQFLFATPFVAGTLLASLDPAPEVPRAVAAAPGAIVVLGGDAARSGTGGDVGPLTLERLRAGAALQRRTGLPLLVTGGPNSPGLEPLAHSMARSLREDFGIRARWIEPAAGDTRDNAVLSSAILRPEGIGTVFLVTHGWHMGRAAAAFRRAGLATIPIPVRIDRAPDGRPTDWVPRPDHLAESWFAIREWAGRLVYALRD
ncbi:YdcF family protein [Roseomonas sp. KE2513]|uniref:YdcF family protein n=1 Tax=Roseomonas sp. KE2513 TaxID=2479202 RepID=UPI0018E053BD|nr:YdcF family protein [Roseomonas sp. KE2513]MBI0537864.1 YdcF family protein [Roseomonas sp. KE2513]